MKLIDSIKRWFASEIQDAMQQYTQLTCCSMSCKHRNIFDFSCRMKEVWLDEEGRCTNYECIKKEGAEK